MIPSRTYQKSTSTGLYFRPQDGEVQFLNVDHPGDLDHYIRQLPKLEALHFNFSRTAFKKAGVDHLEQLKSLSKYPQIKSLSIQGSKQISALPEALASLKLQRLSINNCPKLMNLEALLNQLPELTSLFLFGKTFDVGATFPNLPKLQELIINAQSISSLEQLARCTELAVLKIDKLNLKQLPAELSTLSKLKVLRLASLSNLTSLPDFQGARQLQELKLIGLPSLKEIGLAFKHMPLLRSIALSAIGNQETMIPFPIQLCSCTKVNKLEMYTINFDQLPEALAQLQNLVELTLQDLSIKKLPEIFQHMQNLIHLRLVNISQLNKMPSSINDLQGLATLNIQSMPQLESLQIDFKRLSQLGSLLIEKCPVLHHIDPSLKDAAALQKLTLRELPSISVLPALGSGNTNLNQIDINTLHKLETLPPSLGEVPKLNNINIRDLSIKRLPERLCQAKNLERFNASSGQVEFIPPCFAHLDKLKNIFFNTNKEPTNAAILRVFEVFPKLQSLGDPELAETILYWVGNAYQHLPFTQARKVKSLEALQCTIKNLPLLILTNVAMFNPGQKPIEKEQIQAGDLIWINGQVQGGKTAFKKKLKDLGLKVVHAFSDQVKFVILGKKAVFADGLFDRAVCFASQLDFENISKVANPGLLQQPDVPDDFIHNLQQLLWSTDPQNEAIALELVKNNGLPEVVEDDFLLVAKVCKDKNVKNRIRTFLRGKINEQKQKALSVGSPPFRIDKLANTLDTKTLANLYFAQFKRRNQFSQAFFTYGLEHPRRQEYFEAYLPELSQNPKYLNAPILFLETEWDQLLAQDLFKGQLQRLVINLTNLKRLPKGFLAHIETLKDIKVTIEDGFQITDFYQFYKLNKLHFWANSTKQVPSGIGQLKRLRHFFFYAKEPVVMPDDLADLTKLKRLQIQNFTNREAFRAAFPDLRF